MKILFTVLLTTILFSCSSQKTNNKKDKAEIYFSHGTSHLLKGNYSQALSNLIKAKKLAPERSDVTNNLGMAYYFKKKKNRALKYIKKAIKLDPKNTEAKANLATIYLEAKKYKKARKVYEEVLEDFTYTRQHQIYYNLGKLEMKLGRTKKAKQFFKLSLKEYKYNCNSLFQLGSISLKESNFEKASEYFKKGTQGTCYKKDTNHYYLGMTYRRMNKNQEALNTFNTFLRRFPESRFVPSVRKSLISLETSSFENLIYSQDKATDAKELGVDL